MLTNKTLARINNRPRKVNRLPLLGIGGGFVIISTFVYVLEVLPILGLVGVLFAGALLVFVLYGTQKAQR